MILIFDPTVSKTIIRLALPLIGGMITQTMVNIVDTIMVGYLPKEYSIAGQSAIGYSIIIHWAIGGFFSAIQVGTQAITARRFGEGSLKDAGKVLSNSMILAFFAGFIVSVLSVIFIPYLFRLLTSNEEVLYHGIPYCRYRVAAIIAMVMNLSYKSFFDGIGRTYIHFVVAILMNLLNIILALIFIFGLWGFPKLYVKGAGVAAMIASFIGLFLIMAWSFKPYYLKQFSYYNLKLNFDWSVIWNIVRLSIPSGVTTLFMMSGFAIFFAIVGLLDTSQSDLTRRGFSSFRIDLLHTISSLPVSRESFGSILRSHPPVFTAATKIIIDILSISFMTTAGIGIATATLVSQSLGRKEPQLAERYGWQSVKIAVTFLLIMGCGAVVFPDGYFAIFSHDPEVIHVGRTSLQLMGAFQFLLGIGMVLAQALFGAGNTKYVMWVEMISHVLCLVPLSYLFGIVFDFGIVGIWASGVIYLILVASLMFYRFREGKWKQIKI